MKIKFYILSLFFFSQINLWGQIPDSIKAASTVEVQQVTSDTLKQQVVPKEKKEKKKGNFVKRFWTEDYPSPRKAIILTAVLPGLGQVYNKKFWYLKLPVIYAGIGGLVYAIDYNSRQYRHFRNEYKLLVGDDPSLSIYADFSPSLIKNARDQHDKWRQLSYLGIGFAYILTAAEAFTTAHLLTFDVSDDLSMQLKPSFDYLPSQGTVMGFGVKLQFGKNNSTPTPKFLFSN